MRLVGLRRREVIPESDGELHVVKVDQIKGRGIATWGTRARERCWRSTLVGPDEDGVGLRPLVHHPRADGDEVEWVSPDEYGGIATLTRGRSSQMRRNLRWELTI
jgi:hypothetical protein